jgi:hypothetical protein
MWSLRKLFLAFVHPGTAVLVLVQMEMLYKLIKGRYEQFSMLSLILQIYDH